MGSHTINLKVFVVGIYSRTSSRAAALALEFKIDEVCNSIDLLFKKSKADLVVIAVPVSNVVTFYLNS